MDYGQTCSLDWSSKQVTDFAKFLKKVILTDNGEYEQQVVTLENYQLCFKTLSNNYKKFISKINETIKVRFSELGNSPIFTNMPIILGCKKWPQANEQLLKFGDEGIDFLKVHLMSLLEKNYCKIRSIMYGQDLKVEINLF